MASFTVPCGVAVDNTGVLYVADTYSNTIRKVTSAGVVTTIAGTPGQPAIVPTDGTGSNASFSQPIGIAIDATNTLYVTDSWGNLVRKITTPGAVVTTLAGLPAPGTQGEGSSDGTGTAARFYMPTGVATDSAGNVYVADNGNDTIRKVVIGTKVVTTFAGMAPQAAYNQGIDGTGDKATFYAPGAVSVDQTGTAFVADSFANTIRKVVLTPQSGGGMVGVVTTLVAPAAGLDKPYGVAADGTGAVYVADTFNSVISLVTPAGDLNPVAGRAKSPGTTDGASYLAQFAFPSGVAVDSSSNLYVADTGNNTIRFISGTSGNVSTLAGSSMPGTADGAGSAAAFDQPWGIAVNPAGTLLYVSDANNNTIRKMVLSPQGNGTVSAEVTTLAGSAGQAGKADGTGSAARFNQPQGIALDAAGNIYVADASHQVLTSNSAGTSYASTTYNSTIRKVTPSGVVTTVIGNPGSAGVQVGALPTSINVPQGVAVTSTGALLIAVPNENCILYATFK
jgi:DNA-binding beta-propeller fold protein YncE